MAKKNVYVIYERVETRAERHRPVRCAENGDVFEMIKSDRNWSNLKFRRDRNWWLSYVSTISSSSIETGKLRREIRTRVSILLNLTTQAKLCNRWRRRRRRCYTWFHLNKHALMKCVLLCCCKLCLVWWEWNIIAFQQTSCLTPAHQERSDITRL